MEQKRINGTAVYGVLCTRKSQGHRLIGRWDLGTPLSSDRWLHWSYSWKGRERRRNFSSNCQCFVLSWQNSQTLPLPGLHRNTGTDFGDTPWLKLCMEWMPSAQGMDWSHSLLLLQASTWLSSRVTLLKSGLLWTPVDYSILFYSSCPFQTQDFLLGLTECL